MTANEKRAFLLGVEHAKGGASRLTPEGLVRAIAGDDAWDGSRWAEHADALTDAYEGAWPMGDRTPDIGT